MKRKSLLIFLLVIISVVLFGCTKKQKEEGKEEKLPQENQVSSENITINNVKLFYADINNEKMVIEERDITYNKYEDKYKVILEELIKGPTGTNTKSNIPANTLVYGTIKQNKDLIIDLNSGFTGFPGTMAEVFAVGNIVNTMTQIEGIERVKILVEGVELIAPSGEPRGFMKVFPVNSTEQSNTTTTKPNYREAIIYFANKDATAVVGEKREIEFTDSTSDEEFAKRTVEELIKGPRNQELSPTIPSEAKIVSFRIVDRIANVDFSKEMETKHSRGAAGESMTINSIVNTLTEFDYIEKVKITVENNPLAIEHMVLSEPVGRNESMIKK